MSSVSINEAAPPLWRATWAGEARALFALAWPLVIAQLAQNALVTSDVIMMGWLGPQYLAAGALATSFFNPFLIMGSGIVGAIAPLVAQARGAGDVKAIRRIVRQGLWVAIGLALVLLPLIWQIEPIFHFLGQDPALTRIATDYTHSMVWVFFPSLLLFAMRAFISALGKTRVILVVTLGGVVVNSSLAYGLIFGHFGLPRLELRGAAVATFTTMTLMLLALVLYVRLHRSARRIHILARFWQPDWAYFATILRVGSPIGVTLLFEVGLFSVASVLMGWLGTNEVAAHAVALQLASMAFMVPLGIGIAATVRVGTAYGRRDAEALRKAGWTAIGLGTGLMGITALLFLVFPHPLVSIFLDPQAPENLRPLSLAVTYLAIAALFQLADGAQVVAAHALRGISDTKVPMLLAIVGYWVIGLPIAFVLGFPLGLRGVGIWLGLAAGLAIVAILLCLRFALRQRLGLLKWPAGR